MNQTLYSKLEMICARQRRDAEDHPTVNKNYYYYLLRCLVRNALANKLLGKPFDSTIIFARKIKNTFRDYYSL